MISNESIFQINITRVMFGLKTKKKMYFLASLVQIGEVGCRKREVNEKEKKKKKGKDVFLNILY
jgi:hypothetical protein